jgi:hypothetical protein
MKEKSGQHAETGASTVLGCALFSSWVEEPGSLQ